MIEPLVTAAALLGYAGLAASVAGLVWQTREKRALARRIGPLETELDVARNRFGALDAETQHLAQVRLPALIDREARGQRGATVPGLSIPSLQGTPVEGCHQAILDGYMQAIGITRDRIGLAARSSVRDIVDEAQTFLVRCQMKAIEEMDKFPEGTAYHQSLMDLDHLVTRALHTIQRIRILTGSWPGLQRADCTMREIVESARGRIDAYLRVDYTYEPGTGEVWVEGRVVEPVTVALTELLSNATTYSGGKVSVEVQEIQNGYVILVDDAGLNMNAYQRGEASRILTQRTVLDVTNLPDSLHFGFPVIGRLCGDYGFTVDVSTTSPFGGVRAVLRIPRDLLGDGPSEQEREAARQAVLQAADTAASEPLPPEQRPTDAQQGHTALPQRRRRQPRNTVAVPQRSSEPAPAEDPEIFARGFADLGRAIREGENYEGDQP
ncbi:histidine kinase [Streptomyces sp. NPDC007083]|uniref:histidine kinase n=1 Tax=Streptomyces sp. NPDC007083 TaxID=3156913 RepID=UPI00340D8E3C